MNSSQENPIEFVAPRFNLNTEDQRSMDFRNQTTFDANFGQNTIQNDCKNSNERDSNVFSDLDRIQTQLQAHSQHPSNFQVQSTNLEDLMRSHMNLNSSNELLDNILNSL